MPEQSERRAFPANIHLALLSQTMSSRRSSLAQTANGPPAVPSSPNGHPLSRSSSTHSHLSLWSRKTDPRRDSSDASSTSAPTNTIPGERNPWAGHLGHLTVEQQQALEEFKQDLSAKGIFFEDGRREEGGGQGRGRVDDSTLLYVFTLPLLAAAF
jgi:hypothetical protein